MTRRSFTNQEVQIGKEATHGAGGGAAHILGAATWTFGPKPTTKQFFNMGRHYASASALLTDESTGKLTGVADYDVVAYVLGSHWGAGAPALVAPSTTVYKYIWTPALTGKYADSALSYDIQVGDASDAEEYLFSLFNGFHYSFGRTTEITFDSDLLCQKMADGITKTATPTVREPTPLVGAQANIYLDSTSAGLGTTLLTAPMNVEFKADPYYKQFWPINRANNSFADVTDAAKKHELKIKLEADTTAIALKGSYLETGTRCYVRVDVQGPLIDVTNSLHASLQHDMACFVTGTQPFEDVDGVYAIEYTLQVAEDLTWGTGTAQKMTLQSLLAAIA